MKHVGTVTDNKCFPNRLKLIPDEFLEFDYQERRIYSDEIPMASERYLKGRELFFSVINERGLKLKFSEMYPDIESTNKYFSEINFDTLVRLQKHIDNNLRKIGNYG